jgi:Flp pilus assembly protein TadD
MRRRRLQLLVCLFLIVPTVAVYWQIRSHDFLNYDDDSYVTENRHVQGGLTWKGITWAFTTTHASNWHPLTWLSHMLDCQLYGLNPKGHHLTNLLLHIANTLLLFLVLKRMTGALWRSAFVAGLFALHPLHVESVAWVAERKDVLSTFFWMTTMWAYVRYVECPRLGRYLLVLLLFSLGLMAKPMLITLPFVLLLIDYWPLSRFQFGHGEAQRPKSVILSHPMSPFLHLVREKIPLLDVLPLQVRLANALVAYMSYIGKMIWPVHLAVFYPHPGMPPLWQAAGAGLLLLCVSVVVIRAARRSGYLAVGWLWYLGTLVPVLGLVQVGSQAMADRYTYVPLIGLFIVVAWGVADLAARWRYRRLVLATSAGVVLLALTACTWLQVGHWRHGISLFEHTLDVTANNYLAHLNLGVVLGKQGSLKEATEHFSRGLKIKPNMGALHTNMGLALYKQGRLEEAIDYLSRALQIKPHSAEAHNNIGLALAKQGRLDEAINHFSRALQIKPDDSEARYNLGLALGQQGKPEQALSHYSKTLQMEPDNVEAHYNIGLALARLGRLKEAIEHFSEVLQMEPDNAEAHYNLGVTLDRLGRLKEACPIQARETG